MKHTIIQIIQFNEIQFVIVIFATKETNLKFKNISVATNKSSLHIWLMI